VSRVVINPTILSGAVINNDNRFRYPVDVRFFEVDSLGVVFNMWYLGWCDEAMSAFMESIGYGYATLRAKGFDAVLRNAQIEWSDSLEAFQHAEIAVRVDHVGTTSFRLGYDIDRVDMAPGDIDRAGLEGVDIERFESSGQPDDRRTRCAHVAITYVCVDVEGRGKVPIPGDLREALVKDQS
jgi:YbgC/YbaW family acyl-CoA thioester hydrolase